MAYQARKDSYDNEELSEEERANKNNAENVRNVADVATKSGNPYAVAAGAAIKGVDKVTGGKASEAIGKKITRVNNAIPGGRKRQDLLNGINESGLGNRVGHSLPPKNQMAGSGENSSSKAVSDTTPKNDTINNKNNVPSVPYGQNNNNSKDNESSGEERRPSPSSSRRRTTSNDVTPSNRVGNGLFSGMASTTRTIIIASFLVGIFFAFVISCILGIYVIQVSDFGDGLGVNTEMGEDTGNYEYKATEEEKAFYKKVVNIKNEYQAEGKSVDALKIVATFNILKKEGANVSYKRISDSEIRAVADAMLNGNSYDKEIFTNNLINTIIPKYLPLTTEGKRKNMVNDIFDYVSNYYFLLGKEEEESSSSCASVGSCSYDIKGYYIKGKGNVTESLHINNLYVRLMQCGRANGHNYGGTFGKPLEGEELVPFEKYILGVAYQEIGPDSPAEAIKAQMVAARSFILARHADMGGWRTLKSENDKWVLQVASCTQDQVYCDPDKGCSASNGQWGQVYSGLGHGSFSRGALASNSPLRTYANETSGEVLVNSGGYIIYADYAQSTQNKMISLAKSGLNYKQILLQIYSQNGKGASTIAKNSCGGGENCSNAAVGDFTNWKQGKGSWANVKIGTSGKTIKQIGCLATSVAIQIARSGVSTNVSDFNPGTFVEYLNSHGGFSGGNLVWGAVSSIAPNFQYVNMVSLSGMSKEQKLSKIQSIINQNKTYAVVEVKGNTGQHWVAIDRVENGKVYMMDPGSDSTDMWATYDWRNTSKISYFQVR